MPDVSSHGMTHTTRRRTRRIGAAGCAGVSCSRPRERPPPSRRLALMPDNPLSSAFRGRTLDVYKTWRNMPRIRLIDPTREDAESVTRGRMTHFAERFPYLRDAPGVSPWDA